MSKIPDVGAIKSAVADAFEATKAKIGEATDFVKNTVKPSSGEPTSGEGAAAPGAPGEGADPPKDSQ